MTKRLVVGLLFAGALMGHQPPPPDWPEFQADTLGISFRHPRTRGMRFEARAATCTDADRSWQGSVPDSVVVVTRSIARLAQIAAHLGVIRSGAGWVAEGYQGSKAPVAEVRTGGWEALVADQAVTVAYDLALRSPVATRQWRLIAMGPAADGCRPLILGMATGMAWDSAAVMKVLESARPRH